MRKKTLIELAKQKGLRVVENEGVTYISEAKRLYPECSTGIGVAIWPDGECTRTDVDLVLATRMNFTEVAKLFGLTSGGKERWVTHYRVPNRNFLLCGQKIGMSMRGHGSARKWTDDKYAVTCEKCLSKKEKK